MQPVYQACTIKCARPRELMSVGIVVVCALSHLFHECIFIFLLFVGTNFVSRLVAQSSASAQSIDVHPDVPHVYRSDFGVKAYPLVVVHIFYFYLIF